MRTRQAGMCWCGYSIEENGKCPAGHAPDALVQRKEPVGLGAQSAAGIAPNLEGIAAMPGFAAPDLERVEAEDVRLLKCMACGTIHITSEDGDQVCSCGILMLEAQWGTASPEAGQAEDVRITLGHIARTQHWRRWAILMTIAACVGWMLAVAGWLR